MINPTP